MKDEQENKNTCHTACEMDQDEKRDKIHDELAAVKFDNIIFVAFKRTLFFTADKKKAEIIDANKQGNH